jgi:uncharacterized phosphatase
MIDKKEFFFIRHGETDANARQVIYDDGANGDIPLNEKGRSQAKAVQKTLETLEIQTICVSPMLRARQTWEIAAENIRCPVVIVPELEECPGSIWLKMAIEQNLALAEVQQFMKRALIGINRAVNHPGPVLIIAHGGIHWAMAHALAIPDHGKKIGNCVPVHFYLSENFEWRVRMV